VQRVFAAAVVAALVALGVPLIAAQSAGIRVAAASDLQMVMPAIADRFQQSTGRAVGVSYGSSGNFFMQIQNGAPFDVFLSADIDYPRRLEKAGFAEPGTIVTYGFGRIVVWCRRGGPVDAQRGLEVLADVRVRRIAIANPEHAPYGRAAVAALRHEGLYDRVQSKLVMGENISQAAQFVDSGNADAGIIALSLALSPALKTDGTYYEIPQSFYPPIEQGAVVIKASANKAAAQQFLQFLRVPDSSRLLQSFGFAVTAPGGGAP
jgi:molybdate transport system substrate-binding protein